jgi:asparagine synthase (glutamine-hydrolysing)
MCGIAGLVSNSMAKEARERSASSMSEAIAYRGPDDQGVWSDESRVAFAHRRLSILDLSALGHQPMVSQSGRFVLTYNGEIYNFQELRASLEREFQLSFRGTSDSEVLLAALENWGIDKTLKALNGMFAFGLWDKEERVLTLARDRMGEKPLYYGIIGGNFYFASEAGALAAACPGQLELNLEAVGALLRYNCIPAPLSIYKNISKLEPAHYLTVNARDFVSLGVSKPYWLPPISEEKDLLANDREALDQLESLLSDSVRLRMVSDVPIGAFLSGGVDSSLVTALMQKHSARPVRTFTIGFENAAFDESVHAAKVAKHLGTEHTELFVSSREVLEAVPRMAQIYSEPFSDSSQVPTYLVAALTKKHVTVVLSGDGGDEIFAGYDRYATALKMWSKVQKLPRLIRSPAGRGIASINPRWLNATLGWTTGKQRGRSFGEKMNKAGALLSAESFEGFYSALISQWEKPENALADSGAHDFLDGSLRALPAHLTLLRKMMSTDLKRYLPDDILVKVDRATMSVSLESRIPLLDHRLVELSARLPQNMLVRGSERKWALKQILDRHVPRELIERPKMGFGVPLGEWLRGPLRDWADDLLDPSTLKRDGVFNAKAVSVKWSRHRRGGADYSHDLWPILMFQSWRGTASLLN